MPYPRDMNNVFSIIPSVNFFDGQHSLKVLKARTTSTGTTGNYNSPMVFDSSHLIRRDPEEVLADEVEHYIIRVEERLRDEG